MPPRMKSQESDVDRVKKLLLKIITACLSAAVFSFVLAIIGSQSPSPALSMSRFFIFYLVFTLPVYLAGGMPFSYMPEALLRRVKSGPFARYLLQLLLYVLGGLVVMFVYLAVILRNLIFMRLDSTTMLLFLLGAAGALLYMHIELLLRWIWTSKLSAYLDGDDEKDESESEEKA